MALSPNNLTRMADVEKPEGRLSDARDRYRVILLDERQKLLSTIEECQKEIAKIDEELAEIGRKTIQAKGRGIAVALRALKLAQRQMTVAELIAEMVNSGVMDGKEYPEVQARKSLKHALNHGTLVCDRKLSEGERLKDDDLLGLP